MKATPVYLCCSKRIGVGDKRRPCGEPMAVEGRDAHGMVTLCCPQGHHKTIGSRYAARFSFASLDPDNHHPPDLPLACPNCHIPLITNAVEQRLGTISCGNCGIRLTFDPKTQTWEEAPVG